MIGVDGGPLKRHSEFVNSKTHNAVREFEQEITQFVCGEIIICFALSVFAKKKRCLHITYDKYQCLNMGMDPNANASALCLCLSNIYLPVMSIKRLEW